MRRLICTIATAACTAALTVLPAGTAHAAPSGCTYGDSSAIHAAAPGAPIGFIYPEGAVNPEGQVCRQGTWQGPSIDDGSYDDEPC
jgi:hypothetical protein